LVGERLRNVTAISMEEPYAREMSTLRNVMIVTGGFGRSNAEQTHECLRCGFTKLPTEPQSDRQALDTGTAKRFRDKAAEAEQLIGTATTEARRKTLSRIAESYNRSAEHIEKIASKG
jgi:hypothetical protein